jgi:ribosomal protein S18 acetylase RimI-like enzyme
MTERVRAATPADGPAIAALLGELGYPAEASEVPGRIEAMMGEPGQHVLVAEDSKVVVGLATVIIRHVIHADAPFARLAALVVTENARQQGVGRALVEHAEEIGRAAGCKLIEVTSSQHRVGAAGFYERLGYAERRRRFLKSL